MLFYQCDARTTNFSMPETNKAIREASQSIYRKTEQWSNSRKDGTVGFLRKIDGSKLSMAFVVPNGSLNRQTILSMFSFIGVARESISIKEITIKSFATIVKDADAFGFIDDKRAFLRVLKIEDIADADRYSSLCFDENIIPRRVSKKSLLAQA